MTDDFKKKLVAHHTEEMSDVTTYENLSKEALNCGEHHVSGILQDIADDEKSHAKMLKHILDMQ